MIAVHRIFPFAAVAIGVAVLPGCSGADADPGSGNDPVASAPTGEGDVDRYCALVAEVNGIGERVFTGMPEDAPAQEYTARQKQLVEESAAQLEEMEAVAPVQIRADVPVFLADLPARAVTGESPDPVAAQAAESRIRAFEEENCPAGPDGS